MRRVYHIMASGLVNPLTGHALSGRLHSMWVRARTHMPRIRPRDTIDFSLPGCLGVGAVGMTTLFTYLILATFSGAALAAALVLHAVVQIPCFKRIPHSLNAWLPLSSQPPSWLSRTHYRLADLPLLFLNGLLVATSAVGAKHSAANAVTTSRKG